MENQNSERVSCEFPILVCGVRSTKDGVIIPEYYEYFERCEFYNVSQLGVEPGFLDPLFNCLDVGTIVRDHSCIYFIGSMFRAHYPIPDSLSVNSTGENVNCLKGVAWVDLSDKNNPKKWIFRPPPPIYGLVVHSTVLNGKIYSLSSGHLHEIYEYRPNSGAWVALYSATTPELFGCRVSGKMIPYPSEGCILVQLVGGGLSSPGLYAFYPEVSACSRWRCIAPNMDGRIWKKKHALAEGRLFFYFRESEVLFGAYDLSAYTWATVQWPDRYPYFLSHRVKACSMFYLGNHQICLAISKLICPPEGFGSKITFHVFHFEPSPKSTPKKPTIAMTYLTTRTIFAEGIIKPVEFIPL